MRSTHEAGADSAAASRAAGQPDIEDVLLPANEVIPTTH